MCLCQMQENNKTRIPDLSPMTADRIANMSNASDISSSYCFHFPHCGTHVPLLNKNESVQNVRVELGDRFDPPITSKEAFLRLK